MSDPVPSGSIPDGSGLLPLLPSDIVLFSRGGVILYRLTLEEFLTDVTLLGDPRAPTQDPGDSSTLIASTAFVHLFGESFVQLNSGGKVDVESLPDRINRQIVAVDASRDLDLDDVGTLYEPVYLRASSSVPVELTVLADDEIAWPDGCEIEGRAAGAVEFIAGSSVTINPPLGGLLTLAAGAWFRLVHVGDNEWDLNA